jgi:hypothetical protein
MEKLIPRMYRISKHHDIVVKRVAKKMNISESEVIRRRIKSWKEMLMELHEDQKHSDFISRKNLLK